MITIYKIINPIGKIYIGQTGNPVKRKNSYKNLHCKSQEKLFNSIKKYGWENHIFLILSVVSEEFSDDAEIEYIKYYKSYYKEGGLNLTLGGFRHNHSSDTKKKLSESILGAKNVRAKKLYQYTLDGEFVKLWECMKCIERELGYFTTWLSRSIKQNKPAYGYKWSYEPL